MSYAIQQPFNAPGNPNMRCLIISGVNISKSGATLYTDEPFPDYLALRDYLRPEILDVQTVQAVVHPIVRLVQRTLGQHWAIAMIAFLRMRHYQAIIATGEDVGLPLALLSKIFARRIPLILTCHNIATRRPAVYLGKLRVGSAISLFQCLSTSQAHILAAQYGIPAERCQVIRWHVDAGYFRPQPDTDVKAQICSAGMASRDYATLVEATRDLAIGVKIAADSPWFRQSLNITTSDLPAHVEARSYGDYQALRQLYAESLFVVVPLLDVEFSAGYTVILEAMAMGKAVIVSRIKQVDDFVVDGWNGFHVTPGDAQELAERIRFLLDHPEEARRMGANGRKAVEENYTLDRYIRRMSDALGRVGALQRRATSTL